MMQFTEGQRKALIEWLTSQRDACDEIHVCDCKREQCISNRIALAALTAKPTGYFEYRVDEEGDETADLLHKDIICESSFPLYTATPVAALMLPSELEHASDADCDEFFCDGYNACLDEIKRLNATSPAQEKHND